MATFDQLDVLAKEIAARAFSAPESSYTAKLLAKDSSQNPENAKHVT